jgi:hypothetical protein
METGHFCASDSLGCSLAGLYESGLYQYVRLCFPSHFSEQLTWFVLGIIYSIIAPLVLALSVVTFGLLWIVYRYLLIYVMRASADTGGLIYPRALNQLFVGIYTMELCLTGLFFLVRDVQGRPAGTGQAVVMIAVTLVTAIYQYLLNSAFSSLLRYLPVNDDDHSGQPYGKKFLQQKQPSHSDLSSKTPKAIITTGLERSLRHPAFHTENPVVWIPKDPFGIADHLISCCADFGRHLTVRTNDLKMDENGRVTHSREPPTVNWS